MRPWAAVAGFVCVLVIIFATIFLGGEGKNNQNVHGVKVSVDEGELIAKNGDQSQRIRQGEELNVGADGKLGTPKSSHQEEEISDSLLAQSADSIDSASSQAASAQMQLVTKEIFWISGYSRTEDGKPLQDTSVTVYSWKNRRDKKNPTIVQTNAEGYYNIEVNDKGDFYLRANPKNKELSEAEARAVIPATQTSTVENFTHYVAAVSMRGRVIDKETLDPVEEAEVIFEVPPDFWAKSNEGQIAMSAISGPDGRFTIQRLVEGVYNVETKAKGYQYYNPRPWDREKDSLAKLEVNSNVNENEILIKLTPGGSVKVFVQDSEENPVSNARCFAVMKEEGPFMGSFGNTDEKGIWSSDYLVKGRGVIRVVKDGYGETISDQFKTGSVDEPAVVKVTLLEEAEVSGQVAFENGDPAEDYMLVAYNQTIRERLGGRGGHAMDEQTQTDKNGFYKFEKLGEGKYDFKVFVPPKGGGTSKIVGEKALTLEAGQIVDDLNFTLEDVEDKEAVHGRVVSDTGEPVKDAKIFINVIFSGKNRNDPGMSGNDITNAQGEFKVKGLEKAPAFYLNVLVDGYKDQFKKYDMNGEYITITLESGGSIEGLVISKEDNQPVRGANVILESVSDRYFKPPGIMTGADGSFRVDMVDAGSYKIFVEAEGYARTESDPVTVKSGETTEGVLITIDSGVAFQGQLIGPGGVPAVGASVSLLTIKENPNYSFDNPKPFYVEDAVQSDSNGFFTLPKVSSKGATLFIDPEKHAAKIYPVAPDALGGDPVVIQLDEGGNVYGVVYDDNGEPQSGVNVCAYLRPANLFVYNTVTDESGAYRFDHLPNESFIIQKAGVLTSNFDREFKNVTIREGQSERVDFGGAGAIVRGTIYHGGSPAPGANVAITSGNFSFGDFRRFAQAGPDGSYSLRGIPEGEYRVCVSLERTNPGFERGEMDGLKRITISGDQDEYVVDVYVQTYEVIGTVRDADTGFTIPDAEIQLRITPNLEEHIMNSLLPTKTDGMGVFKYSFRETGTFPLTASKTGYANKNFEISIDPNMQSQDTSSIIEMEVLLTQAVNDLEAHLTFQGNPISGDVFFAIMNEGLTGMSRLSSQPDPERPGVYKVSGLAPGMIGLVISVEQGGQILMACPEPFLLEKGQSPQIFIELIEVVVYAMDFKTSDGNQLSANFKIHIPDFPQFERFPLFANLIQDGKFSFPIPKGRHRIIIDSPEYYAELIPADLAAPSGKPNQMSLTVELMKK